MLRFIDTVIVKLNQDSLVIDGHPVVIRNYVFMQELLPRGANGLVFKANDTILNRIVAIKIWIPKETDKLDRSRKALAEARKIAYLNHPNIVTIYQCSSLDNGWIYSIMEYIDGNSLGEYVTNKHPDFIQRFRFWEQIEEALEYAYSHNISHGDLHQGNVLITGEIIKIIDFGTSIFAYNKASSERREVKLLIQLCKELFHEYRPSLDEITEVDISRLSSIRTLSALSAWVGILFTLRNFFESEHSDDWLISAMNRFSADVMGTPIFSIERILNQLSHN